MCVFQVSHKLKRGIFRLSVGVGGRGRGQGLLLMKTSV